MTIPQATEFSANGKIMITGEYLALKGGRTFAWPTKRRHLMSVVQDQNATGFFVWTAIDESNKIWFEGTFAIGDQCRVIEANDYKIAGRLEALFNAAFQLKDCAFLKERAWQIETRLEWPLEWGFGSSSSMLVNVASWLGIDPFKLLEATTGGSGYDIACGLSDAPIVYEKRDAIKAAKVHRPDLMIRHCSLAYTGQKADTGTAVSGFLEKYNDTDLTSKIDLINRLTYKILEASRIEVIIQSLRIHEETIGWLIDTEPIGSRLYRDFDGIVKSCGAWGGDFILFTGRASLNEYKSEVENKYGLQLFSLPELLV